MARAVAVAAAVVLLAAAPASAQAERIDRYEVRIRIEANGVVTVTEVITYDFGSQRRHGIIREIPDRLRYDDVYDRVYPITVLSVDATGGAPSGYEEEDLDGATGIRIGDPDVEISGRHTYTIVYSVEGVLNAFDDHDELYWNAVGTEWSAPIDRAVVSVAAPGRVQEVACYWGAYGSATPCDSARKDETSAHFSQDGLPPGSGVSVVVAIPKGLVPEPRPILEERWSLGRAFEATPSTVGGMVALSVVVIVGLGGLFWIGGRDRRWRGTPVDVLHGAETGEEQAVPLMDDHPIVVEFAPPDGLRPGQMGTLLDEVAHPLDVTATIVDLAVRGYLTITEVEKKGLFGKGDWLLTKKRETEEELLDYEVKLFEAIFEGRDDVLLSDLKRTFYLDLRRVQKALYADVAKRKWFLGRPDKVRERWQAMGVGALLVSGGAAFLLVRFTHWGLLAVPTVIGGSLMSVGARWMPRRTPKGTGLRRRVLGFREVIDKAETHMARWAEQENVFSKYLPYAIVFGLTDKWAKAFEGLGAQPDTSWYVASQPFVWSSFSDSMEGFSTTSAGVIASTPAGSGSSGFGGGGFSGGGGGGGGGGSW